ncbi:MULTISPECIES: AMP-binding protein [unclassified Synechocystis]|uniref:AMP-binding protein n=1 Tax=unclassified Synechocystis TaxID=2640012 RepID=UPI00040093F8|nr:MULTISPECIES: AMP-binding protein [unclassified Synechocystis]AIE73960.1 O-succinylbenzoic acid--CoA ligase [Synechocystis sp. PCC 6714]MCT0252523.1 AMP-binding protein [Synechocystis sp. CS-94]
MEIVVPPWLSCPNSIASALELALEKGLAVLGEQLPPDWQKWVDKYQQSLAKIEYPKILLVEPDGVKFRAAVVAFFRIGRGELFIANHQWQGREWQQVVQFLQPDRLWGSSQWQQQWLRLQSDSWNTKPLAHKTSTLECQPEQPKSGLIIGFPTGGSSGRIRFALHTPQTLAIAVAGLQEFLVPLLSNNGQINSFCVLPMHHVGGFMQWWRSALTGGKFSPLDYGLVKQIPPPLPPNYVTSLVPTQLEYLLDRHGDWLKNFPLIFLGGAPAWPALLARAKTTAINLAPTYGMTETAAQIATLTPGEFLAGQKGVGKPLPHVRLTIINHQGESIMSGAVGTICIDSGALCQGYIPEHPDFPGKIFTTGDLGYCQNGYLYITGRQGRRIISGGENIDPGEVEAFLLDQNLVQDVLIIGVSDCHWGEMLVAIYVPKADQQDDVNALAQYLKSQLSGPKCPKHWFPVPDLRRSPLGKLNHQFWYDWASEQLDRK